MNAISRAVDRLKNTPVGREFWKHYCALPRLPLRYRFGPVFREAHTLLREHEFDAPEQIAAYQLHAVKNLVRLAYEHVPFYKRLYDSAGCHPDDLRSLEDFRHFPSIDKQMIRNNISDMTVRGLRPDRFIRAATSGSSGEPLTLFWDADRSLSFENAFLWHYYSWHGITPTSRAVQLRGYVAPNGSLFTYVRCNTLVVSCEAYGKDTIANVVDAIIAFQPDVIFAFPSTLLLIGKHILDHRLVGWLNPKVIVTSSERLYAEQEELATRSFRCPIMDLYGNTELTVHAIRCPSGGMHFNPFYGYVEIVGAAGGEIVSTGFSNFAMPFLRYRTGDYAEMSGRTCDCGRHWPCIDRLLGRDGDYLVRDDGTEVAVTILWALHIDMGPNMREFQVSQEKPGLVEFRYVADRELDPDTKRKLMATLSALRGLTFTLRRVPAIPRGPRGKYRMVDQRLNTTRRRLLAETDDA